MLDSSPFSIKDVEVPEYLKDEVQLQDLIDVILDAKLDQITDLTNDLLEFLKSNPSFVLLAYKMLIRIQTACVIPNNNLFAILEALIVNYKEEFLSLTDIPSFYFDYFSEIGILTKMRCHRIGNSNTIPIKRNNVLSYMYSESPIFNVIADDDLEKFIDLTLNTNFHERYEQISMNTGFLCGYDLLNYSMKCGAVKIFMFLVNNDCKPNDFSSAIIGRNLEIIRYCSRINELDKTYALSTAIMIHSNAVFDWLIENEISQVTNFSDLYSYYNCRAFLFFSQHGMVQTNIRELLNNDLSNYLRYLIEKDQIKLDKFMIYQAIESKGCLKILLENGLKITPDQLSRFKNVDDFVLESIKDKDTEYIAAAVNMKSIDLISYFLEKGYDISGEKNRPLILAIQNSDLQIVKFLVDKGADVNKPLMGAFTPLMAAVSQQNAEIFKFVIEKTNNVNAQDEYGLTALHRCLLSNPPIEFLKILIDSGADVNLPDNHDFTPLVYALRASNAAAVKLLFENGAKSDEKTQSVIESLKQTLKDITSMVPEEVQN
ncbi:hypothetical protein TVAG_246690 [Trichomonas vaginalis G3]|uniref:DUF3447 domain-containing protein n=1 Tax=Trichomonas vaginalis (strain ATCC PRA-98 / G3) TaxID=412133 RepID=A2DKK8_TRIV3|nr:protein ubiquitination [Trichomonas vaginalis G3]EAY18991.1 hypothetical protein TVAG_246690 [Trichomonas vaginalis G3]KAI5521216.1 protein ubiquitination [Trichomonas vaginalis G3]|eukprot:XP_001579977.1 hypothetical protein [Trichomonas vaginalis G3]